VRAPIAFTRVDRIASALLLVALLGFALAVWISNDIISPPRPRISRSERPMVGLALASGADGRMTVIRAVGPARAAGLQAGDRVEAIDHLSRPSLEAFAAHVRSTTPGTHVTIQARRGEGAEETLVVVDTRVELRPVTPADDGLGYEDVAFRNASGLTLRGWYIPPPVIAVGRAGASAWGHGNGADRRHWLPAARAVHDAGLAQLLFDFTGRGDSDGEVVTLGAHEAADLRAALDVLAARAEVDPHRLALGGRSMGAAAAILEAADDARVRALVLDGAFADLTELVDAAIRGYHLPAPLVRPVLLGIAGWRAGFDPGKVRPIEAIRRVSVPILLMHGTKDEVVPFAHAERLRDAAASPVTFVPLDGLGHNSPRPDAEVLKIAAFLSTQLGD
jgi:fermentation-respiration switch protein FrsA (DUF1100 family)